MGQLSLVRMAFLVAVLGLASCSQLISGYSLEAYKNATTLKADVAGLVSQSTDAYSNHTNDIKNLTLKLNEAYEFSKGEANNETSTAQWELLLKPDGALYYGFLSKWMEHGSLNTTQVGNWKTLLDRAFDYIICLEANKQSSSACPKPESLPAA